MHLIIWCLKPHIYPYLIFDDQVNYSFVVLEDSFDTKDKSMNF